MLHYHGLETWQVKYILLIWYFWTLEPEKTLESPLVCKIKPVNSKGNPPWIFTGRTDAEAPIIWQPDAKSWFMRKDLDAGKDWGKDWGKEDKEGSNRGKRKVERCSGITYEKIKSLLDHCICRWGVFCFSCVWLFVTQRTVAHQSPLSMGFSVHGKNTGVGCHFLLREISRSSPHLFCLLHWQVQAVYR